MIEHEVNKLDNFICGWYSDKLDVCDFLIDHYTNNPNKVTGKMNLDGYSVLNTEEKDSTDIALLDVNVANYYVENILRPCFDSYISKYEYCTKFNAMGVIEPFNIQYYKPNGGFKIWHTERSTPQGKAVSRHMVFMTYLNDVDDAGETEFFHQKIKFKPQKGLTLIWPADWTFTHRGIPSPSQEKYIITGWYNYI